MKRFAMYLFLLLAINSSALAASSVSHGLSQGGTVVVEHGGGCRKSLRQGSAVTWTTRQEVFTAIDEAGGMLW
jgi:hypothetical protein